MSELILQGAKGGGEEAHTPVEAPNTLLSVSYAKVLVAVGEGTLAGNPTGQDIYLNGTPLLNREGVSNFGGVTWEWRNGSQDQTYIQGMPETSNETSVGVELTTVNPWSQNITKKALSAARVTLSWPALLQQLENGDTVGYAIDYAIDLSTDGGPFELYQQYRVEGKTNSEYERTHTVKLPRDPKSGWIIRVRRITGNSQSSLIQDTMKVKSFTEVVDMKSSYPNTALLFVQFDSRLFGGGQIPTISVETRGRVIRVPDNYDPETRVYSGVWGGAFKWAWTDNPAWVYYDILTQERFGLGGRVGAEQVDKWSLYELSQYCDVMLDDGTGAGTKAPRHTCNIFIQTQADAWVVLRDLASIFNGMTYWNGTQFTVLADKQEDLNDLPLYSRSNVIDGKFRYQTTDERSIFTSALISYDDPQNHYGTEVEAVWEKSEILRWGGDRQTSISAIGCTSRAEAQRRGKYQLLTNMYNRTTLFKTGLQALAARSQPGRIIAIADPVIAGKPFTGRLIGGTDTVVTLDRETEVAPGDVLYITNSKGTQQGRTVKSVQGTVVQVTAKYDETPKANQVWYLESATLKSQLFRVTKITQPENGIYEITGVEYNDSKYAAIDEGARLEARPVSVVPDRIQAAPSPVTISAGSYVEQTMALTVMTISWPQTKFAVSYEVQWRVGMGDWVPLGTIGSNSIDVKSVYAGKYFARVRAINALGTKSVWATSQETTIVGKEGAPNALSSLTTSSEIFGIGLSWRFKPGSEDTAYIDIQEADAITGLNARALTTVSYPTDNYLKSGLAAGVQFWFRARLIDRTGNIGPYTEWVRGASSANADEILDYIKGQVDETIISKELNDRINKIEVIEGDVTNIKIDLTELNKDVDQLQKEVDRVDSSVNWLESQVSGLENQLQNDIQIVNKNLGDAIQQTNDDVENLKSDVEDLNEVVDVLQGQVSAFVDALEYDPKKPYLKGEAVRLGQKLYQAIIDVPVGLSPPNTTYWKDVGDIVTDLGALSSQVSANSVTITQQGNTLTAQAQQLNALDTRVGDVSDKVNANTTAIQNLQTTVTKQGNDISTNSQAITALKGTVNSLETGQSANASAIESLRTTVTKQGDTITAQGQQLTSLGSEVKALQTDVSGVKSEVQAQGTAITGLTTTVTQQGDTIKSHTNSITSLEASVTKITTDLNGLTTKVDATSTAVTNLSNTVTQQGNTITAQGRDITTLQANLSTVTTDVNGLKTTVTAQGSAISNLETKVTKQGDDISSLSTSITKLTADLHLNALDSIYDKAETDQQIVEALNIAEGAASATESLTSEVTKQGDTINAQAQKIIELEASLSGIDVEAVGSAVETLKTQVTSQGNTITSQGQAITSLNNSLTLVDGKADKAQADASSALTQLTTKADASALNSLTTRVTNAEGKITSQGESITKLDNSLTITNNNVTAAQKKADDAYALAETKASSTALQTLTNTVTQQGNTITAQGEAITKLTASLKVTDDKVNLKADASTVTALTNTVTQQGKDIAANTSSLVSLKTEVQFKELDELYQGAETEQQIAEAFNIANGAASATQQLSSSVDNLAGVVTAQGQFITELKASLDGIDVGAVGSAVESLKVVVTSQGNTITSQGQAITNLTNSLTVVEGKADNALTQVATKADSSAVTALTNRVTSVEGKVTSQGESITQLNSNLTITNGKVDDALQKISLKADATAVSQLSTKVETIDGKVTAQGQSLQALTTRVTNTETGVTANAKAISTVDTKVTEVDGKLTAVSKRVDGVYAQVNPEMAGGEGWAGDNTSFVGVWSEQSARIEADLSIGERIDTVQVSVNDNMSAVQQVSRAQIDLEGKASATWAVKLQVTQNGEYKYAGIGLGLENTPGGLESNFIIDADRFSIGQGDVIPFAVQNGQTFIKSAFIQEASITMLQIGDNLQSTDYVAGISGWKLGKGGAIEFNGTVAGGGRLTMTNQLIQVFDASGVLRVRMGIWG